MSLITQSSDFSEFFFLFRAPCNDIFCEMQNYAYNVSLTKEVLNSAIFCTAQLSKFFQKKFSNFLLLHTYNRICTLRIFVATKIALFRDPLYLVTFTYLENLHCLQRSYIHLPHHCNKNNLIVSQHIPNFFR